MYNYRQIYGGGRGEDYIKVLPTSDNPLQAEDLIDIQDIIHRSLKRGLDNFYENGSATAGLRIVALNDSLIITQGSFYIEGLILDIEEVNLPWNGEDVSIYISVEEVIVTEEDDESLRDTTDKYFGHPGAHRLVWRPSINTSGEGFLLGQVINGQVIQETIKADRAVAEYLATFIREFAGNFLVEGLHLEHLNTILGDNSPALRASLEAVELQIAETGQGGDERQSLLERILGKEEVLVRPGVAYINGYRIQIDNSIPHTIIREGDIGRSVIAETIDYTTPTPSVSVAKGSFDILITYDKEEYIRWDRRIIESSLPLGLAELLIQNVSIVEGINSYLISTEEDITIRQQGNLYKPYSKPSRHKLANSPISKINRLTSLLRSSRFRITRGQNFSDILPDDTPYKIEKIEGEEIYTYGKDYRLEGQYINWEPRVEGATRPETGSSYYVTYLYTEELKENVDFVLDKSDIDFIGRRPPVGYPFTVDYEYIRPIYGVVTIDSNKVVRHYNSTVDYPQTSPEELAISRYEIGEEFNIIPYAVRRWKPSDLKILEDRINDLESTERELFDGIGEFFFDGTYISPDKTLSYIEVEDPEINQGVVIQGLIQERATTWRQLHAGSTASISVSPDFIWVPYLYQQASNSQSEIYPLPSEDKVSQTFALKARGLNINKNYTFRVDGSALVFQTVNGVNSLGIRPDSRGHIDLSFTADINVGSHSVTLSSDEETITYLIAAERADKITRPNLARAISSRPNYLLYQTFYLEGPTTISDVGLRIRESNTTAIHIHLLEEGRVVAKGTSDSVLETGDSSATTYISLDSPVTLAGSREYAIGILIPDGWLDIFTARPDQVDLLNGFIGGQQLAFKGSLYLDTYGHLLKQYEEDLSFDLLYRAFPSTSQMLIVNEGRADEISINSRDHTFGTNVTYQVTKDETNWSDIDLGSIVRVGGDYKIRAILSGNNKSMPIVKDVIVQEYDFKSSGYYEAPMELIGFNYSNPSISYTQEGQGYVEFRVRDIEGPWQSPNNFSGGPYLQWRIDMYTTNPSDPIKLKDLEVRVSNG